MASSLEAAKAGNVFLSSLMDSKLLSFNVEKSVVIVCGTTKEAIKLKDDLENNPLFLCEERMRNVPQYSYLGKEIN